MTDSSGSDPAPQGLGFLLGKAHRARKRAWEAELADLGLTAPQAALLRALTAEPGSGVRHLARTLGADVMGIQRIAGTLIAAGLCVTAQDPADARRRPLHLTAEGKRLAKIVTHRAAAAEENLSIVLGPQRYAAMVNGLQQLLTHDDPPSAREVTAPLLPERRGTSSGAGEEA